MRSKASLIAILLLPAILLGSCSTASTQNTNEITSVETETTTDRFGSVRSSGDVNARAELDAGTYITIGEVFG